MKRFAVLALAPAALMAAQASTAAAQSLTDRVTAFASACDDKAAGAKEMASKAQAAKLAAMSKADLAKVAPITLTQPGPAGYDPDSQKLALSSDVTEGWWLDSAHTGQVIYQEGSGNGGKWRQCKVIARAPNASPILNALVALHPRKNPDAWTDYTGKTMVVFGQPLTGPQDPKGGGDIRVDLNTIVPFPDMTFIITPKDPQYEPHTPHPIAVTQAEIDAGMAKPGTVTYIQRWKVGS